MRLGNNAKMDLLERVPLFADCSKHELEAIARVADEIDLRQGAVLTREGQPGREFFVLIEGTVTVNQGGDDVGTLAGGDWFGEIALLTKAPRTATVSAASPVRVLVVTDRAFRHVLEGTPTIAVKMLQRVGERLAQDTADVRPA